MRLVPWWALLSSGLAPVVLIGGWTTAAALQAPDYDPATQTISSLAGDGASDSWLMTGALFALGACHTVTALGLRPAAPVGRALLACGGLASIMVALSPEPGGGTSFRHSSATAVGIVALTMWPFLAADRSRATPWGLSPVVSSLVTAVLVLGAGWLVFALNDHLAAGVAERILTGVQAVWPLVVVLSCLQWTSGRALED